MNNVGISIFDIDSFISSDLKGSAFDDQAIITGTLPNGNTIPGTFVSVPRSNIEFNSLNGLQRKDNVTNNCSSKSLDETCQGSVKFTQAVSSIEIIYNNTSRVGNRTTTGQEIEIRMDNYCYAPPRTISGIVFNDNGGINPSQANRLDANISTGPYSGPTYFNGIFDNTIESGINGSIVKLVDSCSDPKTIYAS